MDKILRIIHPFLTKYGKFIIFKGKNVENELKNAEKWIKKLNLNIEIIKEYPLGKLVMRSKRITPDTKKIKS